MKRGVAFAAVCLVLIVGGAWGITILRPEPEIARAVWTSAVIALGAQLFAFVVARLVMASNPVAGWGLGSLVRFGVLALHAFVGVGALGLSSGPALYSLAAFLFVTMLIEPLFLKP